MDIQTALFYMVEVAMKAKQLHDAMVSVGYEDTPFWDLFGSAADAIYHLLGEDTETFDESVTYAVLNDDSLTNDQRVAALLKA